jgi:hypothetical protein
LYNDIIDVCDKCSDMHTRSILRLPPSSCPHIVSCGGGQGNPGIDKDWAQHWLSQGSDRIRCCSCMEDCVGLRSIPPSLELGRLSSTRKDSGRPSQHCVLDCEGLIA